MSEDNWESSNAGRYKSVLDVDSASPAELTKAIRDVFESYGNKGNEKDQILVQQLVPRFKDSRRSFYVFLRVGGALTWIQF